MKKYRMPTSGEHDRLTADDFRAFGPFTVFPSWAPHSVTPLVRGERWPLAAWLSGRRLV